VSDESGGGTRRPVGWAGGRGGGWAGGRFHSPAGDLGGVPKAKTRGAADRAGEIVAQWAPTAGRILLGLVLAWFGYHELVLPGEWTGYVPVISATSTSATIAVLVHGWVLLVLAVALVAGIAPRVSAAIASVLLLEIVLALVASGLSDTSLRDVGVLGLAICLTGCRDQRLVLRG
jgi:uncharacterized membrane protein YphA (DoxX/SURF4 family)